MTSSTARAASLAATLTALTGEQAGIERDPESGTPTVRLQLPDGITGQVWTAVHSSLIGLPPQDEFGSLRDDDGSTHLWVTLHDPSESL